jgi:ubiquinone biosynthesis protein UbiJ
MTTKAARMAALLYERRQGWLEGRSMDEIARALAGEGEAPVNRSTIMRDLREVERMAEQYEKLVERLRNLAPDEPGEFWE